MTKVKKLDKNINRRWLRALRSGKYEQGTGCLKNSAGNFCCLGVLTDLFAKDNKIPWVGSGAQRLKNTKTDSFLPLKVVRWSGIGKSRQRKLVRLNDSGVCFVDIAKEISKNY